MDDNELKQIEKECGRKVRYETKKEAQRACIRMRGGVGKKQVDMRAYECRYCGGFHFGHRPVACFLDHQIRGGGV